MKFFWVFTEKGVIDKLLFHSAKARYFLVASFLLLLLVILVTLFPYIKNGVATPVVAHDHLDANYVWAVVLAREGLIFGEANDIVTSFLGGIDRAYFGSTFQLYYWLFAILSPFNALVMSELLTRIIALVGAFLFLRHSFGGVDYCGESKFSEALIMLTSVCFAFLPFWPPGGAAVAGVPLFFWAALSFRRKYSSVYQIMGISVAMGIFIIYGSLVTTGVFALFCTSLLIIYDARRKAWGPVMRVFLFNFCASVLFLIQNSALLRLASNSSEFSRNVVKSKTVSTSRIDDLLIRNFMNGQYHADPGTAWPLFIAIILGFLVGCICLIIKIRAASSIHRIWLILFGSIVALALTTLMYGMHKWSLSRDILDQIGFIGFNVGRFHWLQPTFWMTAFGAALILIWMGGANLAYSLNAIFIKRKMKRLNEFSIRCLAFVIPLILVTSQIFITVSSLPSYGAVSRKNIAFDAFFAPHTFKQIRERMGEKLDKSRFGMVGAHPSIAQFNNLKTVGGYIPIYPLAVKSDFRKIIAGELNKNAKMRSYFDNWGSRAYLFADALRECNAYCFVEKAPESIEVAFDVEAFREFGGTHFLSVSKFANAEHKQLQYLGTFENKRQPRKHRWQFHLYSVAAE